MKVKITKEVNDKIRWLTFNYANEISGWLTGEILDKEIVIDDILFPYQTVSRASVDTTGGDLVKLKQEYGNKCQRIIGHFHSHNTMPPFWSQTDEDFIQTYMQNRDIRIFIVTSTQGNKVRLEMRNPINLSIDEVDFEIIDDQNKEELEEMINLKVKEDKTNISAWNDLTAIFNPDKLNPKNNEFEIEIDTNNNTLTFVANEILLEKIMDEGWDMKTIKSNGEYKVIITAKKKDLFKIKDYIEELNDDLEQEELDFLSYNKSYGY